MMSDFELIYLFHQMIALSGDTFIVCVSVIAGFLFIGLFFGQVLTRSMTVILVTLYSFVIFATIFQVSRMYLSFQAFAFRIRQQPAEGADLAWYPVNSTPEFMLNALPFFGPSMALVAYIASLIFFFNTYKSDPKSFR